MSTILFFNLPAHGHVNPSIPLVKELVSRGERVIYYCTETYRTKIESAGAEFRSYGAEYDFAPGQDAVTPFRAMSLILQAGEGVIANVIDQVRAEKPDYIIYDSMCVWGKQIARIVGVAAVCSCSIFLIHSKNIRDVPMDTRLQLQMTMGGVSLLSSLWRYGSIALRLKLKYGVSSPLFADFFANPGDMTLVYTSRYFQAGADRFDGTFKFVGPLIAPRNDHSDWQASEVFKASEVSGTSLIYISLGTLFNERVDFFRACLEAFNDDRYNVIMSIGNKIDPASLGVVPNNFIVRPHVPQLEVLRRADLFITHGGMNSVSEGCWYGVPMIVLPQVGDQVVIASRVAQLGAAEKLTDITPQAIRVLAEKVLGDSSYKKQSMKIGETFREAGGVSRAVDEIQNFVQAI
jgi:MGT family glycosyltransferase